MQYDLHACRNSGHATEMRRMQSVQQRIRVRRLAIRASLPSAACIIVLLAGIAWNVRVAVADLLASRDQPSASRRAMRLDPVNAAYPAQLAHELEVTDPQTAQALFRQAVRLNPYDAAAWIDLGLLYEEQGDFSQAESDLLHAATVDATWLPDWSLANFYFRRQRWDPFWNWARKAAQLVPDDATPILRLAWYVAPKETEIQDRLQVRRPEVQRQFLWFLIAQGDAAAVNQWGIRALASSGAVSWEDVLSACDWLIQQKRPDLALPLWNGLAAQHQIPLAAVKSGSGDAVTNGDFARQPLSRGFDWHLTNPDGVSAFLNANPSALGFEFSGRESESILLMSQVVPVEPQQPYTLAVEDASADIPGGSGLEMEVADAASGSVLARTTGFAAGRQQSRACFTTPQNVHFLTLMLDYQRQPGTVPLEGRIAICKISLLPGTAAECTPLPGVPR